MCASIRMRPFVLHTHTSRLYYKLEQWWKMCANFVVIKERQYYYLLHNAILESSHSIRGVVRTFVVIDVGPRRFCGSCDSTVLMIQASGLSKVCYKELAYCFSQ